MIIQRFPKITRKAINILKYSVLFSFILGSFADASARTTIPADISVPEGYQIEAVVEGLSSPTMVAFDDEGRMLIAESGYDGSGPPKVTRIEKDGTKNVLTREGAFGEDVLTAIQFYEGRIYAVHSGTVSTISEDGTLQNIITGLPGQGDHQANQIVFRDGKMYLGVGTVTNSGVVGPDNVVFGWLRKPELRNLHDVPCEDVTLSANSSFESDDVAGHSLPKTRTSAYSPFGQTVPPGTVIPGNVKCNGAILTANPDGTGLEVYAWGLRNPYGLAFGPDGALYITMHGFDARGSRPIENAWDCIYKVEQGAWYGWPDFACDVPVTDPRFKPAKSPQPGFILESHPTETPPRPIAKFNPHAATNGFSFAREGWGKPTDMFIALFGDFTPATGTVTEPQGVKIVRLDTLTGEVTDFIINKVPGQASRHTAGGLEHPSSVDFGPDGAMYIADWGVANITVDGLKLDPNSGVVWRVTKSGEANVAGATTAKPYSSISLIIQFLIGAALLAGAIFLGRGTRRYLWQNGLIAGLIAGLAMGVAAIIVTRFVLNLPWYAAPALFASIVMGRTALAEILIFDPVTFIVGLVVLLALTGILGVVFIYIGRTEDKKMNIVSAILYALSVWVFMQYFIFPMLFPIITEKGFPPHWFAIAFILYGFVLGWVLNNKHRIMPWKK